MINLIPKEEKEKIIKSFHYKLIVLFLLTGGVSFLFAFVAILPPYFISSTRISIINKKLEIQNTEQFSALDQQIISIMEDLNKRLNIIEGSKDNKFIISERVIKAILPKKISGIKVTSISYGNDQKSKSPQDKKINIEGNAPSREALLLFRKALEEGGIFKSVDLPISNFVKESNIKFSLSLIPS